MKIIRIFAHRVEPPLHEKSYKWSAGKSATVFLALFLILILIIISTT